MLSTLASLLSLQIILIGLLVLLPLERLLPLASGQKIFRRGWKNDLCYFVFNGLLLRLGVGVLIIALVLLTEKFTLRPHLVSIMTAQPLWLQCLEVIVLADLGFYTMHRMFHAIPWMWKFHRIHHSIKELDWLAGARVHMFDQLLTRGLPVAIMYGLGFSEVALVAAGFFYQGQSMLIHANIRTGGFGPLRWLLASPEYHHWHHGSGRLNFNTNFAGQLPFLDLLFGTAYMPRGEQPKRYGIKDAIPDNYISQFFYPLDSGYKPPAAVKTDPA